MHWAARLLDGGACGSAVLDLPVLRSVHLRDICAAQQAAAKIIVAENALELPTLAARDQVTLINTVPSRWLSWCVCALCRTRSR